MGSGTGQTLPIRCACGALRGRADGLSPSRGNRVVCYCEDCQAFTFATGCAERVLDEHGGSDIFQMSPAQIHFEAGLDQLACLRLSPDGLPRWYAACCGAPIANVSGSVPFCGFLVSAFDASPEERDRVLGPVRHRVQAVTARGQAPAGAHAGFPLGMFLRLIPRILAARLRGDQKRSPFVDPATGGPIATPRIVDADERARIASAQEAWRRG